jgi:hypothetical protein
LEADVVHLYDISYYSQDGAKFAETLEKLVEVRRKHGTKEEVRL